MILGAVWIMCVRSLWQHNTVFFAFTAHCCFPPHLWMLIISFHLISSLFLLPARSSAAFKGSHPSTQRRHCFQIITQTKFFCLPLTRVVWAPIGLSVLLEQINHPTRSYDSFLSPFSLSFFVSLLFLVTELALTVGHFDMRNLCPQMLWHLLPCSRLRCHPLGAFDRVIVGNWGYWGWSRGDVGTVIEGRKWWFQ